MIGNFFSATLSWEDILFSPKVKNCCYKNIHPIQRDRENFMRGISQKIFTISQARGDFTEGKNRAHSVGKEMYLQHSPLHVCAITNMHIHMHINIPETEVRESLVTAKCFWTSMTVRGAGAKMQDFRVWAKDLQSPSVLAGSMLFWARRRVRQITDPGNQNTYST